MKTTITITMQKMDIPHPMYVTTESAVDSDGDTCHRLESIHKM